jgi:hypothetical protein
MECIEYDGLPLWVIVAKPREFETVTQATKLIGVFQYILLGFRPADWPKSTSGLWFSSKKCDTERLKHVSPGKLQRFEICWNR